MKVGRKILSWGTSGEYEEEEAKYRLENWKDYGYELEPLYSKVLEDVRNDQLFYEIIEEDFLEALNIILKKKNKDLLNKFPYGYWKCEVENFGWRNQNGFKFFEAHDAQELLSKILPKTECIFNIYNYGKNGIVIQNFHHDNCTGREKYYITKMTEKEKKKYQERH